jgi:hypothetical protein
MRCERVSCQQEFIPSQGHQRFCSPRCRMANKQIKRRRAGYRKPSEKVNSLQRKQNARLIVQEAKKPGCSLCSENHPAVLDFHHRDRKTKVAGVNRMAQWGYSETRLRAEIAKCDVLCANCHRKVEHALRMSNLSPSPCESPG